jgi:alpha-beta hydrolase superfamily lysophospholipase
MAGASDSKSYSPTIVDDPEAFIRASEAQIPGIRPAAEKQIVWAHPDRRRTAFAIVYFHGFSASAGEIRPVPDRVAANIKANLFFARLTGHGIDGAALGRATIESWLDDIGEAIAIGEALGEKVILMGVSTGGALATWALSQPRLAEKVAAAVLISPNYGLRAAGAFLLNAPFARQLVHLTLGRTRNAEARTDLQRKIWTTNYPTEALLPMARVISLARKTKVEEIHTPALFFYSPDDRIVDPTGTVSMAKRWGGPHRVISVEHTDDPNRHVIAGDAYSPSTTDMVITQICAWLATTLRLNS